MLHQKHQYICFFIFDFIFSAFFNKNVLKVGKLLYRYIFFQKVGVFGAKCLETAIERHLLRTKSWCKVGVKVGANCLKADSIALF